MRRVVACVGSDASSAAALLIDERRLNSDNHKETSILIALREPAGHYWQQCVEDGSS